jgi:hypothetical protein
MREKSGTNIIFSMLAPDLLVIAGWMNQFGSSM